MKLLSYHCLRQSHLGKTWGPYCLKPFQECILPPIRSQVLSQANRGGRSCTSRWTCTAGEQLSLLRENSRWLVWGGRVNKWDSAWLGAREQSLGRNRQCEQEWPWRKCITQGNQGRNPGCSGQPASEARRGGLPWWSSVKNPPYNTGCSGSIAGQETKIPHVRGQLCLSAAVLRLTPQLESLCASTQGLMWGI